jgi:hypothetical protein
MNEIKPFTPIGETNFRNHNKVFGIKPADRLHHIMVIGKTGMGKSHLLISMAADDILKGNGICVIDPHGDTINAILKRVPRHRMKDVAYFNATNREKPPAFNPLHNVPEAQRQLVASEMITTFKRIFLDAWGSKLERILRMCILTLLDYPQGSLLDISALLTDLEFRFRVLQHTKNPYILTFWKTEYNLYSSAAQANAILPLLNKVGVLLESDVLRGILGQQRSISFDSCMEDGRIVLVNLSKGIIGEDVSTVLGSFIITNIQNAAMRRAALDAGRRKPFYLFVDEAQSFVTASFATMLPQVRKYAVGLYLTTQTLDQIEPETRSAIMGNVGTIICFRLGLNDAKVMEREFHPVFTFDDFTRLPNHNIYLKLLIDGSESKGFSAVTLSHNE